MVHSEFQQVHANSGTIRDALHVFRLAACFHPIWQGLRTKSLSSRIGLLQSATTALEALTQLETHIYCYPDLTAFQSVMSSSRIAIIEARPFQLYPNKPLKYYYYYSELYPLPHSSLPRTLYHHPTFCSPPFYPRPLSNPSIASTIASRISLTTVIRVPFFLLKILQTFTFVFKGACGSSMCPHLCFARM